MRQAAGREESSFCEQKEAKKLFPLEAVLASELVSGASGFYGFASFSTAYPAHRRSHEKKFFASFFQKRRFLPSLHGAIA